MTLAELKEKVDAALAAGTHPLTDVMTSSQAYPELSSYRQRVTNAYPWTQNSTVFLIAT